MPQTTMIRTFATLQQLFSVHGLPEEIVSDKGSQFTLAELQSSQRKMGLSTLAHHHIIQHQMEKQNDLFAHSKK